MKLTRIGVIGRTAYETNLCDGQTVKTRVLVDELKRKYPNAKIDIADTYLMKHKPASLFCNILTCLWKDDVIFVLLSVNGRNVIFPIIKFFNIFLKKIIIHDCIGGKIGKDAMENRRLVRQMNSFTVNYVESPMLVKELCEAGVKNAEYLPNFKRLNVIETPVIKRDMETITFCTFSRVCRSKGITDAIVAVKELNCILKKKVVLDIYGPIEQDYKSELDKLLSDTDSVIRYKGVVDPQKSVEVLKNYYALLFPTVFEGEGFPGTLIDALSSGTPVIATDWHLNGEIIEHGRTGFLYEWNKPEELKRWMIYAIENPNKIIEIQYNCIEEAKKYHPDILMNQIDEKIKESMETKLKKLSN